MRPQTIQIFLPDGNPRGIKIAEITNRLVQAIYIPRNLIKESIKRPEIKQVGIYILIGESNDELKNSIYIGEAEECLKRIKQHNKKEYWNIALALISKTNSFTKAHVKYLEYLSIITASNINRFKIENSAIPSKPFIPESMEADLLDNFDSIKILTSTLGYPIFESFDKNFENFTITSKGINANGRYIEDGFLVLKGSEAMKETSDSCHKFIINLREQLISNNILKFEQNKFVFNEDYIFKSPSTSAGVVLGRAANGWNEWKNRQSKTLDELYRNKK